MTTPTDHPKRQKSVDAALAEYNALRAETIAHLNSQAALTGVGLTALGVIFGVSFGDGGDIERLLFVPPLALVVCLLTTANHAQLAFLGRYIRKELWPYIQREVESVEKLPSWEGTRAGERRKSKTGTVVDYLLQVPTPLLLVLTAVTILITLQDQVIGNVVLIGWVCVGIAVLAPAIAAAVSWRRENHDHDEG